MIAKKDAYYTAKQQVEEYSEVLDYLQRLRRHRVKKYEDFKKFIDTRARRLFSELIRKRGYRGELILDHEEQKLNLNVL